MTADWDQLCPCTRDTARNRVSEMKLLSPLSTPVFPTPHIRSLSRPCGIESGHSVPSIATIPSGFLCVVLGLLQSSPPWPSYFTCSCPSRHDSEPVLPAPPASGPFLLVGLPRAVLPPITLSLASSLPTLHSSPAVVTVIPSIIRLTEETAVPRKYAPSVPISTDSHRTGSETARGVEGAGKDCINSSLDLLLIFQNLSRCEAY